MKKLIATFLIVQFLAQVPSYAAFWHKDDLGNKIKQEEYPDSKDKTEKEMGLGSLWNPCPFSKPDT